MTASRVLELAYKVMTKPPSHTLRRVGDEVRRVAWRPWARIHPRVLTDARLLGLTSASSIDGLWRELSGAPFYLHATDSERWSTSFRRRYPGADAAIVKGAGRILRHEFDLLGSGLCAVGEQLPWHTDFKTGREWPLQYSPDIEFSELDRPTYVKVPWELSRCQHFPLLGQAYWLTGDERYAQEYVAEISDWIARNPWG